MNNNEDFSGITFEEGDLSGSKVNPLDILRIEKKLDELGDLVDLSFKNGSSTRGTDYAEIALSYYDQSIKELNLLENLAGKDSESYKSNSRKVSFKLLECAVRAGSSHPKYNEINDLAKRISPVFGSADDFISSIKKSSKSFDGLKKEEAPKEKKTENSKKREGKSRDTSHQDSKSVPEANERGFISRYFEDKSFGFIKDKSDNHIFFHKSSITNFNGSIPKEGMLVSFATVNTSKGPNALNVSLLKNEEPMYDVSEELFVIRKGRFLPRGTEIIDTYPWIIHAVCRDPNDHEAIFKSRLNKLGANAVLNVVLSKETRSESGTGRGTHYYTMHNFYGVVARVGTRSLNGQKLSDLPDLNPVIEGKHSSLVSLKRTMIALTIVISLVFGIFNPVAGVLALIFFPYLAFKIFKDHVWLEKIKK